MLDAAGDTQLHLYVLGRFELRAGGRVLLDRTWARSKAKALIKLLALQRDHSLHRERVMDALWPDLDRTSAANNLHKNLHYLRSAVQDARVGQFEIIESHDNILALSTRLWIDADAFRELVRSARKCLLASVYEEALALYGGELLPEDLYEAWAEIPRDEVRTLHLRALLELSELYQNSGGPHVAELRLLEVLELDALNEDAHRRLMGLYARAGNRDHALHQYQKLREALRRELGVEPSVETRMTYTQILAEDPARTDERPAVAFAATSDGVKIAYQVHPGTGGAKKPPLLFMRGWLSHVELLWEDGRLRTYFEAIAQGRDVVLFDMRGNGLSDRHVPPIDVAAMVLDLEAVVAALGLERFLLYGATYGGPPAALYAARHSERVEALILDGSYAKGESITKPEFQKLFLERLASGPAGFMLLTHLTGKEGPRTRYRRLDHTAQMIASDVAVELYALSFKTDISSVLNDIAVPTLVIHRRDSTAVPMALGRELAEGIPDARFVALPGNEHNSWEGDADSAIDAVVSFLDSVEQPDDVRAS